LDGIHGLSIGGHRCRFQAQPAGEGLSDLGLGESIAVLWAGVEHGSESVVREALKEWDGAIVRKWLESRVIAARADQVTAERYGRGQQDDCDKANAEEMICALLKGKAATNIQSAFSDELKTLLDRDEYVCRGVYDDRRFDRHVRSYIRKLMKMTKANTGFENITHYQ
jgi:hypothetical protein